MPNTSSNKTPAPSASPEDFGATPAYLYSLAEASPKDTRTEYHRLLVEHGHLHEGAPNPLDVGWDAAKDYETTHHA